MAHDWGAAAARWSAADYDEMRTVHWVVSWMRWGSAGLACVPPVALLVSTHILGTLWRFDPVPPPDGCSRLRDRALELAAERMDRWEAAAAKLHEEGYCPSVSTEKIAGALRYLYECRAALSLRAIGAQPEVGLHHDTMGKIRDGQRRCWGRRAARGAAMDKQPTRYVARTISCAISRAW